MKARERAKLLRRVSQLIADATPELNKLQTLDNGMPLSFANNIHSVSAEMAADIFDHHAGWVDKLAGETLPDYAGADYLTFTLREPVGVVAAVIPWNAPTMLFAQKVAPALAAGCTVVMKPSEYATLVALELTRILEQAGVPQGVFNLVPGPGTPTGEALVTHPMVDMITFTGSRAVGGRMLEAAATDIKKVALELGGKSPTLFFDDVPNLDLAAANAVGMVAMGLSGQGCVCHTRALVQRGIYDDMVNKAGQMTGMATQGDPFELTTTAGPLINTRQLDKVMGYIDKGQEEGARLVAGGTRGVGDLTVGNFVVPTVFADVDNQMTIAREEIFGPVLAMIPFEDEADGIRLANETAYGLGASVYTTDVKRALRVAKAVRAGTFGINGYRVMPNAPFGGYGASGLGREGGQHGIEEFTELKTVNLALTDALL